MDIESLFKKTLENKRKSDVPNPIDISLVKDAVKKREKDTFEVIICVRISVLKWMGEYT